MYRSEILYWLCEGDEGRLDELWRRADAVRQEHVGDGVHLRGLIEFSNHCCRQCAYCGLRSDNCGVERYRMTAEEIMECVRRAVAEGFGTVVLQSGEDYGTGTQWLAALIRRIKSETPLAVTLSVGERPDADLAAWRAAGADRYLLRFETSNRRLYERIHPPVGARRSDRLAILGRLRELGYETGGGVMVGIPGQTVDDLAADIETFRRLDLDMIGVGPYIPHPQTPLGRLPESQVSNLRSQITLRSAELMTCKVVALARLACPRANIPSTTALAAVNRARGQELGLSRGANVVMPNLTLPKYRERYEIYPGKAELSETTAEDIAAIRRRIVALGRRVGTGPGSAKVAPSQTPALAPGGAVRA